MMANRHHGTFTDTYRYTRTHPVLSNIHWIIKTQGFCLFVPESKFIFSKNMFVIFLVSTWAHSGLNPEAAFVLQRHRSGGHQR